MMPMIRRSCPIPVPLTTASVEPGCGVRDHDTQRIATVACCFFSLPSNASPCDAR
jgi:hypothetical protein